MVVVVVMADDLGVNGLVDGFMSSRRLVLEHRIVMVISGVGVVKDVIGGLGIVALESCLGGCHGGYFG